MPHVSHDRYLKQYCPSQLLNLIPFSAPSLLHVIINYALPSSTVVYGSICYATLY